MTSANGPEYESGQFGDNPEMADELADLIVAGKKTATCAALWSYESDSEPLPEIGDRFVVLDGKDKPRCVIETTAVEIRKFNEVDAAFARAEGEGDLSLECWREAHWEFFSRDLAKIGREPTEDMPLVCEWFRVISQQG